jgi:hypothetical protein
VVDILRRVAPSVVLVKRALKKVLGRLLRVGWNGIFFEIILEFFFFFLPNFLEFPNPVFARILNKRI